jgi:hypothetical protein
MNTPELVIGRPSRPAAIPVPEEAKSQPRIYKVTVRSAYNGKLARTFAKVPYGGAFSMTEVLTRALTTGEISWFRVEPAKPSEITKHVRETLQRWPEALRSLTDRTGITWLV